MIKGAEGRGRAPCGRYNKGRMSKRHYVTTPIYYVNSVPHVGHALTMLCCDISKRYRQLHGEEVVFLTGTDENGLKVYEAALAAGEDPIAFVDRISQTFRDCADALNMEYDIFFRTTSDQHRKTVQALFARIQERGHIYIDKYEGWYDVSSETFVKESEVVDGKSPDGNPVRWVEEENYFFRLSSFGDALLAKIESEPGWLIPDGRKNEVVSFIKQGLRDICITRANPGWGIPVPGDEGKVIYVWFDALINYLAASGWPDEGWETLWPCDVHWMAKEIFTRFHATLWPAMLMAADLPLPKHVAAHGWFVFGDEKMSKSKGNVLAPEELIGWFMEKAGLARPLAVDAVRWSLARSLPFENDSNYTREEVARTYNSDLANDIGNALNRSLTMAHKFAAGIVPGAEVEAEALTAAQEAKARAEAAMDAQRLDRAAEAGLDLIRWLNKYIDTRAPWALAKAEDPTLPAVVRSMLLTLRTAEALLRPFIPTAANTIARQLGVDPLVDWAAVATPDSLPAGVALMQPEPMFPRLDKTIMEDLKTPAPAPTAPATPAPKPAAAAPAAPGPIEFADFMKVELKVARIIEAEPVEGSDKLMKLQVRIGDESRQILAGIKKKYGPADLIGRQVVVVANLKPRKMMGMESQGMVLAADDADGSPILLTLDHEAPDGTSVH